MDVGAVVVAFFDAHSAARPRGFGIRLMLLQLGHFPAGGSVSLPPTGVDARLVLSIRCTAVRTWDVCAKRV